MLLERLPRKTLHNVLGEEFIRWTVLVSETHMDIKIPGLLINCLIRFTFQRTSQDPLPTNSREEFIYSYFFSSLYSTSSSVAWK